MFRPTQTQGWRLRPSAGPAPKDSASGVASAGGVDATSAGSRAKPRPSSTVLWQGVERQPSTLIPSILSSASFRSRFESVQQENRVYQSPFDSLFTFTDTSQLHCCRKHAVTTYSHVDYFNNSWMSVLSRLLDVTSLMSRWCADWINSYVPQIPPPRLLQQYSSTVVVQVRVGRGRPSDNISSVEIWNDHADSRRYETIINLCYKLQVFHNSRPIF